MRPDPHVLARLLSPGVVRPLTAVVSLAAFCVALWVIHREASALSPGDIRAAVARAGTPDILAALLLSAVSYLALIGFDHLGLSQAGTKVPYRQVAVAAFTAQAISHTAGFAALTGTSIRLRLYANAGLGPVEVARLMVFCGISFALGASLILALSALGETERVAAAIGLPAGPARVVGTVLLAGIAAYVALAAYGRPLRIRGWPIRLPALRVTLGQIALSMIDWAAAGSVLYVLLPADLPVSLPGFLGLYVIAVLLGVLSHVPGGIGVFEGLLLAMLPGVPVAEVLSAAILYRLVYNLLPLVLAVVLLVASEAARGRKAARLAWLRAGGMGRRLAPPAFAMLTMIAGLILLVSSMTPAAAGRIDFLSEVLPLPVLEASHLLASIAGILLLLLARGLMRRLDSAWLAVFILAAGAIPFTLLKGGDWEEATLMTILAASLWMARPIFRRRGSLLHQPLTPGWLAAVIVAVTGSAWLGWFAFRYQEYSGDQLWTFAFDAEAPRALRATALAATVAVVLPAMRLLGPARPRAAPGTAEDMEKASRIVEQASVSSANLALVGDKSFLFSPGEDAFIMYSASGRSMVAMGDPVGAPSAWPDLIWSFRELCDDTASWPVFYQIRAETLPHYLDLGLRFIKLGEEAIVPLAGFSLEGKARAELRYAHRRALKEGVSFEILPKGGAGPVLAELAAVSDAWMAERRAREKRFSLGRFDPAYLDRFPVAVARRDGAIVAFANLWPSADRRELAVDLMRHAPGAGYGIMDFLFTSIMLRARDEGWQTFSLGMVPLAGLPDNPLAPAWSRVGTFIFERGEGLYNFQGLRRYKDKFLPEWHPRFMAAPGGTAMAQVAVDVASLIGGGLKGVIGK